MQKAHQPLEQPEPEPEPELELAVPQGAVIFKREAPLCWDAGRDRPSVVEVVDTFESVSALVARLRLTFPDGSKSTVVGKAATGAWNSGAGLQAVRRELRFLHNIAPLWPCPAPKLVGARDVGDLALLLSEDLATSGYTLVGTDVTEAQLEGAVDSLVAQHVVFWENIQEALLDHANPNQSLTQSAQAWPPEVIRMHAAEIQAGVSKFTAGGELSHAERSLLSALLEHCARHLPP